MLNIKSFKLGAHTVRIVESSLLDEETHGEWNAVTKTIVIKPIESDWAEHYADQVLLHEMVHAALDHLGRRDLSVDETLVDGLSEIVLQILNTMEA